MSSHGLFYHSTEWLLVRESVLARDGGRCVVGWLLGGECSDRMDVHHIRDRREAPELELDEDNLVSVCSSHHPSWAALRRLLRILGGEVELPPCGHRHPYREGRLECERRRREQIALRRAEQLARV